LLRVFKYLPLAAVTAVVFGLAAFVVFSAPTLRVVSALSDREERPCISVEDSVAIIVVQGQSNAGNSGTGSRYTPREAVDSFDPESGKCFSATDLLPGADGSGSTFVTRLGDILIQSGKFKRVIVVSIAVGGASLAELTSTHLNRIENLIVKLNRSHLVPTHFLFEQGETDAALKTTEAEYLVSLKTLVKKFRSAGFQAPFYIALATKCDEVHPKNILAIRSAQANSADVDLNIRRGPDIDMIGNDGRARGNCHMNEVGTLAQAALWAAFVGRL
jgi:Carbohydrate esterase, sialic acid-specific acetylesterase